MISYNSAKKRKRDKLILLILALIVSFTLFIVGGNTIRIVLVAVIGIISFMVLTYKLINFITTTGKGSTFAYIWNELVYSIFGVPILVVSVFYLPIAIYILFFTNLRDQYRDLLKWIVVGVTVLFQLASVFVFLKNVREDRKPSKVGKKFVEELEEKKKNKEDFETLLEKGIVK